MARRWLVNTSNNRLVGVIDDDDAAVPAGREGVAQNVITGTGVARADIKTNGMWIVTNGVGVYTAPAQLTTVQVRALRRATIAQNIEKNWLPAANGALLEGLPATAKRLRTQIEAMIRVMVVDGSIDDHYATILAESQLSGEDFILYAGDEWDNDTDGFYRDDIFPNGASWRFHTIHDAINSKTATENGTGGLLHNSIGRQPGASTFNWAQELRKVVTR